MKSMMMLWFCNGYKTKFFFKIKKTECSFFSLVAFNPTPCINFTVHLVFIGNPWMEADWTVMLCKRRTWKQKSFVALALGVVADQKIQISINEDKGKRWFWRKSSLNDLCRVRGIMINDDASCTWYNCCCDLAIKRNYFFIVLF